MNMLTRNIILIAIDAFGRKIEGKTMLQKRMYFLAELLKQRYREDPGFEHNAYFYGPYSSSIANDLTKLVNYRLVRENIIDFGTFNSSGFEVRKSEFELTPAANAAISWIEKQHPGEAKRIREIVQEIKSSTGSLDYFDLSIAAKAHWILHKFREPMTSESVAREAKKLSWDVTDKQIEKGFTFLEKLGLVKAKPSNGQR